MAVNNDNNKNQKSSKYLYYFAKLIELSLVFVIISLYKTVRKVVTTVR